MPRFIGQRAVQRDDIAAAEQLLKGDILNVGALRGEFIIGDDMHAEAAADVDEHAPDLAGADNTDGLAVEVEAGHAVQREIEIARADIRLVDAPHRGQQERHCMLRDRIGRIRRHMHNAQTAVCGSLQIHIVVACAAHGDIFALELRELIEDGSVKLIVDKRTDAVAVACEVNGILGELGLIELEFDPVLRAKPFKGRSVIGFGVKKCNSHRQTPF